jgi:hypothetical protein
VLWDVVEDGAEVSKWWPCTFAGALGDPAATRALSLAGQQVQPQVRLSYDAFSTFPPCDTTAKLLDERRLVDSAAEGAGILFWRREGSAWAPDAAERDRAAREASVRYDAWGDPIPEDQRTDTSVSMAAVLADQKRADEESGVPVHDLGMTALASMRPERAGALASGYRDFADRVKQRLRALQATRGRDHVVTASDIETIVRAVKAEAASRAK